MYRDIPEPMRALVEPVVEAHGHELVDLELRPGRPGILRVTIDTVNGDGRVPVGDLARVSREIESVVDAADVMKGSYRLELSSPGLDRVLGREKDFAAACGQQIKLSTKRPLDGRRRFRGKLVSFSDDTLRVAIEEEEFEIPFSEVEKANTVYEFSRDDFKGGRGDSGKHQPES